MPIVAPACASLSHDVQSGYFWHQLDRALRPVNSDGVAEKLGFRERSLQRQVALRSVVSGFRDYSVCETPPMSIGTGGALRPRIQLFSQFVTVTVYVICHPIGDHFGSDRQPVHRIWLPAV